MMRPTYTQIILLVLTLLSALVTVAIGVAANIATTQIPAWVEPYLPLAWPSLAVLTALLLVITVASFFTTLRQSPAKIGPPSRKLVQAYLQEVAADPVRTLADEVLGEAEFIPREVTAQKTWLFPRFAAAYRPAMPAEAEAGATARPEPLEAVLARENRLVLLGEPGMGKTTSLRHLAWEVARHALAKSPAGSEPAGDSPEISIYVELKYYKGEAELETLLARRVDDILKRRQLTMGHDEAERTRVMRARLERKRDYATVLGDRAFMGEWDEVVIMLAGVHGEPAELVKWLAAEALAR
jgi:hypothetical protein